VDVEGSQRPRTARESPVHATRNLEVWGSNAASKAQEPEKAGVSAAMAAALAAGNQAAAVLARDMILLSVARKAVFILLSIWWLEACGVRVLSAEDTMGMSVHWR